MDVNSPSKETVGTKVKQVAMSIEHPFVLQLDPESIRVFLRKYEAYWRKVFARALQLTGDVTTSLEPVKPVSLIYCVDDKQLESAIECGLIDDYTDVDMLTSEALRKLLDKEAEEFKDVVTEKDLVATVQVLLHMKISFKSAKGRMKLLFMEYRSLLRTNGIKWVTEKTLKMAIKDVLSAIMPTYLRSRLKQDIGLSYHHLRADFNGFLKHALKVSEAFELVDSGRFTSYKFEKGSKKWKSAHLSISSSSSKAGV